MLSDEEFADLLRRGEAGGVEFKRAISLDDEGRFKVVRAALGLSNRSDGGYIVMGVEDPNPDGIEVSGVPDQVVGQWSYDHTADLFAEYADPRIRFELDFYDSDDGKCLVFRILEFDELPVLCKRDAPDLRRGACYVRPRGKAETVEVGTQEDMRELVELAVEKSLRRLLSRVGKAGGEIVAAEPVDGYAVEAEGFL